MIVAIDEKTGKKVRATEELPHTSEGGSYRCTYKWCPHPEMILRKGKHVIPHFAHKEGGGCDELSEADTESHLQIKDFMQGALKLSLDDIDFGDVEGVRPDIRIIKDGICYAIELQCSPISDEVIRKRNEIYIKNKMVPIWIFDSKEFLESKGKYGTLRVAERYVFTMQSTLLYFNIDKEKLDDRGFPEIKLFAMNLEFPRNDDENKKFIYRGMINCTIDQMVNYFPKIADNWKTFRDEIIQSGDYVAEDLYQRSTAGWNKWRKSVICNEIRDGYGACNKRFYVHPSSTQTKCNSCIEATILRKWYPLQDGMTVKNISVDRRTLIIEGIITAKEYISLDAYNAGNLFSHIHTIDQLNILFRMNEKQYHDLRTRYENQLNTVYGEFNRIDQKTFEFKLTTTVRERKTKAHNDGSSEVSST